MSGAWSIYVIIGTVVTILASFWLILWSGKQGATPENDGAENTGHVWDGLTERNEPLPRWWLYLFILTLIFGFGYLVYFPGFGSFSGVGGWSQHGQYEAEMDAAEAKLAPIFAAYRDMPVDTLVTDERALRIGRSLFSNYCTQCHGSLGYGAAAFPNLTDGDWLYGGDFASIQASILNGRQGVMPALGAVFADDAALDAMVEYVRNFSAGPDTASPAHAQFQTFCASCHMPDGSGMQALGAPALNDDIWLYGSSPAVVKATIVNGRNGIMPAHQKLLGDDRVRLLTAYVYSLSRPELTGATTTTSEATGTHADQ